MAATDISNLNAVGYDRYLLRTVETKGGKMHPLVRMAVGDLYREKGIYPRITGGGLPQVKTSRFGESPTSTVSYSNRAVTRTDYVDGIPVDRSDLNRMVVDPRNEYMDIMAQRMARQKDLTIQAAALGTALGGDAGATSVAFGNGLTDSNIVDVTLGAASGVTNAGFTYEKLKNVIKRFEDNDVTLDDNERPVIVISPSQKEDMLGLDKFINNDYTERRLIDGGGYIEDFMGVDIIVSNILPFATTSAGTAFNIDLDVDVNTDTGRWTDTDSSDVRICIAMVRSAVLFEVKPDMITRLTEREDRQFQPYFYCEAGFGAVRMEEEKVIAIPCDQSPA